MATELWQVYYVVSCRHAKPVPKNKFVVIVGFDENQPLCMFINSKINNFIKNRPYLLDCQTTITQAKNPFLSYDSYVDCQEAFVFSDGELTDLRGTISEETIENIFSAVSVCDVIKGKHKAIILSAQTPSENSE